MVNNYPDPPDKSENDLWLYEHENIFLEDSVGSKVSVTFIMAHLRKQFVGKPNFQII